LNISVLLNNYIDEKYKNFHQKICPTNYIILGVKIPVLRNIAKELLENYNYQNILNNLNDNFYEHLMLQGLIIANAKVNYDQKLELIKNFLPKIDNWAICDVFCSELKFIKKYKDDFFKYINTLFSSNKEYYQRFAIVVLLNYYINDDYIDFILQKMLEIKSDYYYVKMATSWCLSICLIKYFDKTVLFMINNKNEFDKWIYNKAIQKARESFRISTENKETLKNLKIK